MQIMRGFFLISAWASFGCFMPQSSPPAPPSTKESLVAEYDVHLVGNFSPREIASIALVSTKIERLAPGAFDHGPIVIEEVDSLESEGDGASAIVQQRHPLYRDRVELIRILDADTIAVRTERNLLSSYEATVAHELGHILLGRRDTTSLSWRARRDSLEVFTDEWSRNAYKATDSLGDRFFRMGFLADSLVDLSLPRQPGYVSNYGVRQLVESQIEEIRSEMEEMEANLQEARDTIELVRSARDSIAYYVALLEEGEGLEQYRTYLESLSGQLRESVDQILQAFPEMGDRNGKLERVISLSRNLLFSIDLFFPLLEIQLVTGEALYALAVVSIQAERIKVFDEDKAEVFAYIVLGEDYADDDPLVQQKISAVLQFLTKVYGSR